MSLGSAIPVATRGRPPATNRRDFLELKRRLVSGAYEIYRKFDARGPCQNPH
jgi:hypothetical protein